MKNIIIAPPEALYLSEFMTDFPNGILNKIETGVGATTIALTNNDWYIIAVPTVELIQNKCSQHSEVIGVYGGTTMGETLHKLSQSKVPKIMVTYDSLPKLIKWLTPKYNVYEKFKLLIDEYQELLGAYSYRDAAIDGLLEESLHFKYKCFVSATPINAKYTPPQLEGLDYYEIQWSNTVKIKPHQIKTNKPFASVVNIIKNYKAANYELAVPVDDKIYISKEAYFFVNSVKAIKDIIDTAELVESECKIICADNPKNRAKLEDFPINIVSDPNKPFTFITSKAFCGADFYSESGITFVVSNVHSKTCLYDVATDIFQIAGRIRTKTNPFKNFIYHIYNTGASEMTREDFDKSVATKRDHTLTNMDLYSSLTEHQKEAIKMRFSLDLEDDYLWYNEKTKEFEYNKLKEYNEEFRFSIAHETYTNGLTIREAYLRSGFDIRDSKLYTDYSTDFIAKATTLQFKSIIKEYCDLIDGRIIPEHYTKEDRLRHLELLEPTVKSIVERLGTSKCRTLNYAKKSINEALYTKSNVVTNSIKATVEGQFEKKKVYASKDVKLMLQQIYDNLKLNKKARATDISEYFIVEKKPRNINGKTVDSIVIINNIL